MSLDNSAATSLAAILPGINATEVRGPRETPVRNVVYDSRNAAAGSIFVALPGIHQDGHQYIGAAVGNGCRVVVHSSPLSEFNPAVTYVRVPDSRIAMSRLSALLHREPSRRIPVIGVTGTDGKSTTVFFIYQLLEMLGYPAGFLSTVAMKSESSIESNPFRQSTPEAPEIHSILDRMIGASKRYAVVEATSHGLSPRTSRLADIAFRGAVLTNVTHEHLEFHGTFEQYRDDKANLFRSAGLHPVGFGVVNRDDRSADHFIEAFYSGEAGNNKIRPASSSAASTNVPTADETPTRNRSDGAPEDGPRRLSTYALESEDAELRARIERADLSGTRFRLQWDGSFSDPVEFPIPVLFNVENFMAAALAVHLLLRADKGNAAPRPLELAAYAQRLKGVAGRMVSIRCGQPFDVLVDYAHTPGAFGRLFPLMRSYAHGRLICVFGSGGERDIVKRPEQGRIASQFADVVILADEDPRGEEPMAILRQIAAGVSGHREAETLFLIPDRRQAIAKAFHLASPGDSIVLLGKGHEYSIIGNAGPSPWDEQQVAREELGRIGYGCAP